MAKVICHYKEIIQAQKNIFTKVFLKIDVGKLGKSKGNTD